jgi:hypothetical protein
LLNVPITRSTVLAQHADAVGFVDHQAGAVRAREPHDRGQIREVAHHGVETVDDEEDAPVLFAGAPQLRLEVLHVVVPELAQFGKAQAAAVDDRSVVLAVAEDDIVLPGDGGDRSQVRLEPGREAQCSFLAREPGEPALEFFVQLQRAVQEARTGTRGPVAQQCLLGCFQHLVVVGQAQIVVAADHDEPAAVDLDFRAFTPRQRDEVRVDPHGLDLLGPGEGLALLEDVHFGSFVGAGLGQGCAQSSARASADVRFGPPP